MLVNYDTSFNMLWIIFSCVACALVISVQKKNLLLPFLLTALYIPDVPRVVIFGLNFTILRVLLFFCFARLILNREIPRLSFNEIDKILICWVIASVIFNTVLWGTLKVFQFKMGFMYDVLGIYFLFRFIINGYDDINEIYKVLAIIICPLALIMVYEMLTGFNPYSYLGGVPQYGEIREGSYRCQGPFRTPILAGTFGATSMPLFVALYYSKINNNNKKILPVLGIVSSVIIVIASHSSGPLLTLICAVLGLIFWKFRDKMKMVLWGLLLSLIGLHIYMKAPVWYIFARFGDIVGGGGWHRSEIINQAIEHFGEWWLIGTKKTDHWMGVALSINPDSADITNAYVGNGMDGGILVLILFVLIIVIGFAGLGRAKKTEIQHPLGNRFCIWAVGASLFSHVITFFHVSYFDQMTVFWYMLLAIIASIIFIHEGSCLENMEYAETNEAMP